MVLIIILVLPGVLYLMALLTLYLRQGHHVYRPAQDMVTTPDRHGLNYEDVVFKSSDGVPLNGWFIHNDKSSRVILFLHGNKGNIADCIQSLRIFNELGYSTLLFDYRGYGKSGGHPDEQGTYRDAEAAWNHLLSQHGYAPDDIIVFGRSLGAAIASWLAAHHRPGSVVIESTFTSIPDIAAHTYRLFPTRLITRFKYNTLDNIRRIGSPVLFVHSSADTVIPYSHGLRLYDAAPGPKWFMNIDGNHAEGFLATGQPYIDGLGCFFDNYMRRRQSRQDYPDTGGR